ncbi:MAG: hypothetical protein Q9217_005431 [Psora testacea]
MADSTPKSYHTDPQLYLYTSLSSGSSSIVTATSRLQTILKANKISFQALDVATDEKARMLWSRRAGKRKLPGLDIEQVEEWNEYGEVKENLSSLAPLATSSTPSASSTNTPSKPPQQSTTASGPVDTPSKPCTTFAPTPRKESMDTNPSRTPKPDPADDLTNAMRQAGFEAAKKAGNAKTKSKTEALEAAKAKAPYLQKVDYSTTTGIPPPSGTTEAGEAKKPETTETNMGTKAEEAARTQDESVDLLEGTGQAEPAIPTAKEAEEKVNRAMVEDEKEHVRSTGQEARTDTEIIKVAKEGETANKKDVQPEKEVEPKEELQGQLSKPAGKMSDKSGRTPIASNDANSDTKQEQAQTARVTAATGEAQELPGSKTQDQPAADVEKAGESVAD